MDDDDYKTICGSWKAEKSGMVSVQRVRGPIYGPEKDQVLSEDKVYVRKGQTLHSLEFKLLVHDP